MFTRLLSPPLTSFFVFGPRGTGKSTWIKNCFPSVPTYDLLDQSQALRFSKDPHALFMELRAFSPGSWVVIDEVQKVPALLDEVHKLIEDRQIRFVLSGSSARKLKRESANLLAGRAITLSLFPLVSHEMSYRFDLAKAVELGTLPLAVTGHDAKEFLRTYVTTYLQEEVKAEALTRNIGAFARFLEIAARQNGQTTNVSGIARDAMVGRPTVDNYFQILIDTLIGYWLPAWKLKRTNKQIAHPKFYFFDPGVARALSGRLPYPPLSEETGTLLETFVLCELRAYLSYKKLHYPLHYWSSVDQVEVDVLFERANGFVALEIKSSSQWRNSFGKGLRRIREELKNVRTYGLYLGERPLVTDDGLEVLPVMDFLKKLWADEITT